MRLIYYKSFMVIFSFFLLSLTSCDTERVFEENRQLDNSSWPIEDTLTFVCHIADTSIHYDIFINVRNGGLYEYSNLFLFIHVEAPNGNSIDEKFEIQLAEQSGKWLGSGLGDIKSVRATYKQNVKFSVPGIYTFKVVQGMRENVLEHIYDVGLRIQKSEPTE